MIKNKMYSNYRSVVGGLFMASLFIVSCSHSDNGIEEAVRNQLSLYPEMTLQDLYKAFFQAEFGPEHILADTTAAGMYLDQELAEKDDSPIMYEPVGGDSAFFRVHLCAVQQGKITRDELFSAFVDGALGLGNSESRKLGILKDWTDKWKKIESVIKSMDLNIENYDQDKEMIDSVLASGNYAVHHSEKFNRLYHPHYRIVRKDIFLERLSNSLK